MTCCGDYLVGGKIEKAHCIDGDVIEQLFYPSGFAHKERPTRKECGCTESTDIGAYDTCPHGCIYCYANVNNEVAIKRCEEHDPDSAFLGYSRIESDMWVDALARKEPERENVQQMDLF